MKIDNFSRAVISMRLMELGIADDLALRMPDTWLDTQARYHAILHGTTSPDFRVEQASDFAGRLVVGSHNGLFALLYCAFAGAGSDGPRVSAIVGDQGTQYERELASLASRRGFSIDFIHPTRRLIVECRKALAAGSVVVMLPDAWSQSPAEEDLEFAFPSGSFFTRSTLVRLIGLLDSSPIEAEVVEDEGGSFVIRCRLFNGMQGYFATLYDSLRQRPWEYERLLKLHRMFRPARAVAFGLSYRRGSDRLFFELQRGKTFRIGSGSPLDHLPDERVCRDKAVLDWIARRTAARIDALIHI
ncbi:hypothetical protein [Altererythrobacter sp. Root672]|uniref:hypothetical protein n=1 Tax=Altererythrobacter sp. Root672 TaxID=1736584 RepID=UPI0006FAE42B|nr:hypothetical protein [Altererythrobacter sp. Root672]KRA83015.1 hypothetical protein ASD76_02720 [Altererythrobacter sp. Root672]